MKHTQKYLKLMLCLSFIAIIMVFFSLKSEDISYNSPVLQMIHEKDINTSALFYSESEIPVTSSRKLEKKLNQPATIETE